MMRYRELERDKATEAREHPMWAPGEILFREWRTLCKHPNSKWTPDRFWDIEPFLTNGKYAPTEQGRIDLCRRAIAGAAFDCFVTQRKNGSAKRHDDWDLIFRNASKFEEFCNRAPLGWTP